MVSKSVLYPQHEIQAAMYVYTVNVILSHLEILFCGYNLPNTIHGTGIVTYIKKNQPNVGKYICTIDPMYGYWLKLLPAEINRD